MPATFAIDQASSPLSAAARVMGLALLTLAAALAFAFAAAAAAVIGLLVLGAAIALRFAPGRRVAADGPQLLDARRTPSGWVVETRSKR